MSTQSTSTLRIDLDAYRHNLTLIRTFIAPDSDIIPVIKNNAYGHGMIPIAKAAIEFGVPMLATSSIAEGIELRQEFPKTPILTLLQPSEDELISAIRQSLTLTISDTATAERVGSLAQKLNTVVRVHCEVDTGMGRQGFFLESAAELLQQISRISNVDIEGIYTHFPTADEVDDSFTVSQIRNFRQLLKELSRDGIPYEISHAANSAGVLNYTSSYFDMVRPGIITYGIQPNNTVPLDNHFRPVASWTTRVVLVRNLPGGVGISYGRTYNTKSAERIAVIPVGYGDGYPRALSNCGEVLIHGKRCPIRGRVTMNEFMVDVTHLHSVSPGDTVTLLGKNGTGLIRAEELAQLCGTIGYEIMTGIAPHVDRQYVPNTTDTDLNP